MVRHRHWGSFRDYSNADRCSAAAAFLLPAVFGFPAPPPAWTSGKGCEYGSPPLPFLPNLHTGDPTQYIVRGFNILPFRGDGKRTTFRTAIAYRIWKGLVHLLFGASSTLCESPLGVGQDRDATWSGGRGQSLHPALVGDHYGHLLAATSTRFLNSDPGDVDETLKWTINHVIARFCLATTVSPQVILESQEHGMGSCTKRDVQCEGRKSQIWFPVTHIVCPPLFLFLFLFLAWDTGVWCAVDAGLLHGMGLWMEMPGCGVQRLRWHGGWVTAVEEKDGLGVDRGRVKVVLGEFARGGSKSRVVPWRKAAAKIVPTSAVQELRKDEIGRLAAPQQRQGWVPNPPRGQSPA
ncbi:hypothetical protein K438DRAFT_1749445 [Mycena galopus ATCC 62051]|nr:hypothetical protein K438DRAFT_1749445 [Mycena galopus ATCC 62051]